jgi:small subunit ribosomal protein S6
MDEKLGATLDSLTKFLTSKGGVIGEVEQWGKRKLAYPIKHFLEGNYVLIRFKVKPGLTRELKAHLLISEEVLRHLLVRLE